MLVGMLNVNCNPLLDVVIAACPPQRMSIPKACSSLRRPVAPRVNAGR
jgi:hypothetical protein